MDKDAAMDLIYSDEHAQLDDSARAFFGSASPVSSLRALRDNDDPLGYDPAVWRQMAELGWTALPFPEEYGGLDFGFRGLGPIFEHGGSTLAASPLLSSVVLAGSALLLGGNDEQRLAHLPALAAGSSRFALAVDEGARHNPLAIATSARPTANGYRIDGSKALVIDGYGAEAFVVAARNPGGAIGLLLVPADAAGVTCMRLQLMDSRNAARLHFDAVEVGTDALLGRFEADGALLDTVLDRGRACICAEMLGIAQRLFDTTIAYLKQRVQFDVPIGSFQALQHRAASMYVELELARSTVMAALDAIEQQGANRTALVSLAKWKMGTVLERISDEAVQMHGGIGVTDELDVGLFLKRGRVLRHLLGDNDFHNERYAATIGLQS